MTPKRSIIPIFIPHMGCTHECVFCDQRSISGQHKQFSTISVESIFDEAMSKNPHMRDISRPVEIAFYGGSFTALSVSLQDELLLAASQILKYNPDNSIRISTRPDCIDMQTVLRLKSFGVATIELGVQSMCEDVLLLSGRGHSAADAADAANTINAAGVCLILQMMTGLPGDSTEKSIYTANKLKELKPDGVRIYPTVVVKGTALHNLWLCGEYKEHTVDDAIELCALLYEIFDNAGIPIIRLGLNPSDELSAGLAVAGAYHPSLGELVYSRVWFNRASKLLEGVTPGEEITLIVKFGNGSRMRGNKRENITKLIDKYGLKSLTVIESNDAVECIAIKNFRA